MNATATDRDQITEELQALAIEIRAVDALAVDLFNQRNDLWERAARAGVTSTELGEMFGVQAQTVRHFLRERGVGPRQLKGAAHG